MKPGFIYSGTGVAFVQRNFKVFAAIAGFFVLAIGAYGAYSWQRTAQERDALYAFLEAYELYDAAVQADSAEQAREHMLWSETEASFEQGYKRFSGTRIAPFFLLFQARALAHQKKVSDAVVVMNSLLQLIGTSHPLHDLYAVTCAAMQIDSPDSADQAVGLASLEQLARDTACKARDAALFYLTEYYAAQSQFDKAQELKKEYAKAGVGVQVVQSPWLS